MKMPKRKARKLIFECWCNHNGYYYHDFRFKKKAKGETDGSK